MILGDIANFDKEKHLFPEVVRKGIEYIRKLDLGSMVSGKYELEGSLMYANVQEVETKPFSMQRPESHVSYIDIQFLVSGQEKIRFIPHSDLIPIVDDRLDLQDIVFYESSEAETEILMKPGMFAVFFPTDIHRPCCSAGDDMLIKKVVVKIHRKLWEHDKMK